MKILLLSRYSRLGASSRIRSLQYLPYLGNELFTVHVCSLFNDEYVNNIQYGKMKNPIVIIKAYCRRLISLIQVRHFDLIWIEKEILPLLPGCVEKLLFRFRVPYLVDYDDAIFHRYDLHPNRIIRMLLGKKIDRIMGNAELVTTGNHYLEERAKRSGAKRVEYLPSVIDLARYDLKTNQQRKTFTIGWIGSPTTTEYLNLILPALENLCKDKQVNILLIGSQNIKSCALNLEIRRWSEETEVDNIRDLDVGIMPMLDTPWTRGKCGYKLIQYMACGLPVVASPVEANLDIVKDGVNGYLASGMDEWITALNRLKKDHVLRYQMGKEGRKMVEEKYCVQVTAPRLIKLLENTLQSKQSIE